MISGILVALVFILLTVYIPNARSVDPVSLRNQAKQLSDKDIKSMLTKFNFFDRTKNMAGAFVNDFVDNGDETVTDRVTGLMWQKEGSSEGMTWANAKVSTLQQNSCLSEKIGSMYVPLARMDFIKEANSSIVGSRQSE